MNWASQRLRAMQTGNARQLAAESVVEAACCRACCQMIYILVKHAKASNKRLKAATWGFPSATERCRICMIVLASASPRRRILVLELRSVSQRIPAHSCLHSAQLRSDQLRLQFARIDTFSSSSSPSSSSPSSSYYDYC